jgi:hypothetical protein
MDDHWVISTTRRRIIVLSMQFRVPLIKILSIFPALLLFSAMAHAQFASDRYLPEAVFARLGVKEMWAITTPAQDTLHSVFNARGQEIASASTDGMYVRRTYDARFRPDSVITRYVYDGQLVQMETAVYSYADTAKAPSGQVVYDADGNIAYSYAYKYDARGYLIEERYFMEKKLRARYKYSNDSNGRLMETRVFNDKNQLDEILRYERDAAGNMIAFRATPAPGVEGRSNHQVYVRNAAGLVTEHRVLNPQGQTTQRYRMEYDVDGLLLREEAWFPDELPGEQQRLTVYVYRMQ